MAAFCNCCGAEIKSKNEACAICGMPYHGMAPSPTKSAPVRPVPKSGERKHTQRTNHLNCFLGC
jgi:hypothetical protein